MKISRSFLATDQNIKRLSDQLQKDNRFSIHAIYVTIFNHKFISNAIIVSKL